MSREDDAFGRAKHHFYLGLQHIESSRYREAEIELRKSLEYVPDRLSTLANLSAALLRQKKYDEAEAIIGTMRTRDPTHPEGLVNEGILHLARHDYPAALASFDRAILARADYAEAHNNRGAVLAELHRLDDALGSLDRAISLKPSYVDAYCRRGDVQVALRQLDAAVASYEKALGLDPGYEYLLGVLLHAKMLVCDWRDLAAGLGSLIAGIEAGQKVSPGFCVLSLTSSARLQQRCASIYVADKYPAKALLGPIPKTSAPRPRIRLAYYSADFHQHAMSHLMAGLFEQHDRGRFELFGFSFGPERSDGMRLRISSAFDKFVDVREMSDQDVARMSRDLGIDVAVDLNGLTQHGRPGIFALRAAPVQVGYLGFPGTMGADYIDYLVADRIVVPEDQLRYYSEKVAYLPHCYQVNDGQRTISGKTFTRAELGLPADAFVFCCFNSNYKITPEVFDAWARILGQVGGSVLWLLEDNPTAARNLRREARSRGIDAERLVFAPRMPNAEHLARHRAADLFLDTAPYNAHTTASDALWAGLPVLTLAGSAFQARVAWSLLSCVGLPELVTSSAPAYEAMAVRLAREPEYLADLRNRLDRNRLRAPLFDTPLFARHIEEAYARMYERYCRGFAPETFYVQNWTAG